jgi:uncharacterized membrane protein
MTVVGGDQQVNRSEMGYSEPKARQAGRLFATSEIRILAVGLLLAILYAGWMGLGCVGVTQKSQVFMAMTATQVVFGRAAGMSFGYAAGFDQSLVIPAAMVLETILVLLFYPLFVLSWRSLLVIPALKRFMERTHRSAEAHHVTIHRFGIPGLMFFVWFPFWMTGPVVGCAIGFLLGLRSWLTLTVVLSGTYLAIGSWAVILRKIHQRVAAYNPYAPIFLVGIAMVILLMVCGFRMLRRTGRSPSGRGNRLSEHE